MRLTILSLISFILASCASASKTPSSLRGPTKHYARITFYHRFEDQFGAKTAMGIRAKETVTVSGPKQISLGTKISIPQLRGIVGDGNYKVQDRGRMITGMHFDVYLECNNRTDARRRLKTMDRLEPFMDVYF